LPQLINCIAHGSSEGQLLIGDDRAALFDCGMMFCAEETVRRAQEALQGRPLDDLFITHTHYDHIGALPVFRREWPGLRLLTSDIGAAVLLKDTPRRVIRELSQTAAQRYGGALPDETFPYNGDAFHADKVIKEGDVIPLGGVSVEVLETPGHTRDCLSYFLREIGVLVLSETPGVLLPDGVLYPSFLTGFGDTLRSIEKCDRVAYDRLSLPHRGLVSPDETVDFFDRARAVNVGCREFILEILGDQRPQEEMLALFRHKYFSDTLAQWQPEEAFMANAKAMFACVARE